MNSDQQPRDSLDLQSKMVLGSRLAAIMLSCISVVCSLVVVVSYIRMLRRFRAHQRRIIEASMGSGGNNGIDHLSLSAAAVTANGVAATCFSCESSLATPCVSKSFFSSGNNAANSHQLGVPGGNGRFNPVSAAANGVVGVGIGMTPQNVLLQFREPSINASSAGGNSGSAAAAPASMHRSSMPPLPHMPLSADSKHKTADGSRATSLDRICGAYGRLSSGMATSKKQQHYNTNGPSAGAFPATLDVVASAPASAAMPAPASVSASAPLSLASGVPGQRDGCSDDHRATSQQQQQQQQQQRPAVAAAAASTTVTAGLEAGAEPASSATPPHENAAARPHKNKSGRRSWPWIRSWTGWWWWRPGVFGSKPGDSSGKDGAAPGKAALGTSSCLDIFGRRRKRRKLPRIPSSKIAVLSGIDLLMHALWIVNTTAAKTQAGCTATFFFYHWIQLFYLFFLASFVSRSAMRLRNLQPIQSQKQRQTDMIYCASTLAASLVLSLLPAVMYGSGYDGELGVCWFQQDSSIAVRWLWMSLNAWVVISLMFLIANSIYVAIILSNERRDLLSFIAHPLAPVAPDGQRTRPEDMHYSSLPVAPSGPAAAAAASASAALVVPTQAMGMAAASGVPKSDLSATNNMSKQYYYAGNHPLAVVSSNRMTLVANDAKKRSGHGNAFGAKSTPRTSRESLAIYAVSSSADKQESRRLSSYPATHPVALAHEALHGRRPAAAAVATATAAAAAAASSIRNSAPIHACFACSNGPLSAYAPGLCDLCKQGSRRSSSHGSRHGSRHNSDILQYGVSSYIFGRAAQWATGSNSSRCSSSSHSQDHKSSRYSVGNSSMGVPMCASRPDSLVGPDRNHVSARASSARMYAAATPSMALAANDSDSSRICAPQPWDSSRRLLHKHSYGSSITTPAESVAAVSDRRPLYGFYAQKPVNRRESGNIEDAGKRRMPKHMSMPVAAHGSGCRRVSVAAAAAAAIQRHNSRRQSAVSDDPDRSTQNRHFSVHNPYGIRYQQQQQQQQQQQYQQSRRQHKRNHYSMDPRLLESARAGRNTRMPSIHEDIARADEDGDGGNVRCYADYPDCLDGPYSIGGVLSAPAGVGSSASAVAATAAAADTASGGIAVPGTRPIHVVLARTSQPTSGQWPYAIDVHGSAYCAAPMRASAAAATSAAAPMPEAVSSSSALKPAASGNQRRLSNQVKAVDSRRGVRGAIARLFGRIGLPSVDGQQQKSHGQIQRIERRVHTLVATGALRVATRAMVPLVTQLCMVIWSTTHSLLPEPSGSNSSGASKDSVLYSVAILLLSLQGILDMALYFIYDTHSDASEVSLPGSAYPMLASSHHVNMIHAGGGIYGKSPVGNYAQTHQPSLLHLHGDIYYTGSYTPRGSQDAYMHANHYYSQPSHHHMHGLRRWGSTARQTANHYGRPNSFTSANSNGSNLSTGGAVTSSNGGHGGAYGMVGGVGGSNNGGGVNSSGRIGIGGPGDIAADGSRLAGAATGGSALDRKFAFNMESLNIRRVDRTSNAMQSDTLNGSDCMAWSHTDGLSVHDAPSTISLFSASGPVHNYSHRPVLSGWEEIELEDVGQSFDYHHRHQQQQQQQQQHCADNWSSTDISRAEL